MHAKIVIGAGFGDEGKGITTSFLCHHTESPIVVRFNGGHQAGHTVRLKAGNMRHVFSSFGSGTLQRVPTYWSKNCTFYPPAFNKEYAYLEAMKPLVFVDPMCPVTTPFDVEANRKHMKYNTVGAGFGHTIARQEKYYKLHVMDLEHPSIARAKMEAIAEFYKFPEPGVIINNFMIECYNAIKRIKIVNQDIIRNFNPIFEGAQGIMLDMDHGIFPDVTRSNTTSKSALEMLTTSYASAEIYYVIRSYHTRHGKGFFPEKEELFGFDPFETNRFNEFQGEFKKTSFSIELFKYAMACDNVYSKGLPKNLVITHLDQVDLNIETVLKSVEHIVKFKSVYISKSPYSEEMQLR